MEDLMFPVFRRLTPFVLLVSCVALLATAGCQADPGSTRGDLTITVDTVGNIVRVTNNGTAPAWRLTQVVSVGPKSLTDEGSPDEFGSVSSASLGPDDALFVADALNREIRVFGLDGAHRVTFGRMGEGPGEFDGLYSVAWTGDRLLTLDPHLGRISEFSAEGELLGQRAMQRGLSGTGIRLMPVGADETYSYNVLESATDFATIYVGHDSRGETGDTAHHLQAPPGPAGSIICRSEGGRRMRLFRVPFGARLVQHPGPGGVMYSAMSNVYRIAVTRDNSDTLRVIERVLPSEPISDEEWETGNEEFREFVATTPDADCDPRRASRPETKPFIAQIFIASDGKLWVEVVRTAGNRWEVFGLEGRLLGSVPVPEQKERAVPAFGPETMITIRQDSLELDHVDVWRIER